MEKDKTIFLVDDNITNLIMGKNVLKDRYNTFTMQSAQKMFDLLEIIEPNIIILDIYMPDITGYEAIERLKNGKYKDIPIIFLTGNDTKEAETEAKKLGAAAYIKKPFSSDKLLEEIGKLIT
jgi:putative two-component system response regulator